jgi:hypothetical protein
MLQTIPHLRATTILSELQRRHAGRYPDRLLRSLQSRIGGRPRAPSASSSSARSTRPAGKRSRTSPMAAVSR